jgi:hypothetical protein
LSKKDFCHENRYKTAKKVGMYFQLPKTVKIICGSKKYIEMIFVTGGALRH